MLFLYIIIIILGLLLLYKGASLLLQSIVYIGDKSGIPKFVLGVTVMSIGTSIPELIVNIMNTINGRQDLIIGDALGSNISNILLIVGLAAIVKPIRVKKLVATRDIPFAITSIFIFALLVLDTLFAGESHNQLSRSDGIILLIMYGIFIYYVAFSHQEHFVKVKSEYIKDQIAKKIILAIIGLIALILGGTLVVENAVLIAEHFGIAEKVVGLTIIAIGTSLPELVTVLVSIKHKETDIGIGNIIGSNIANLLLILGASVTVAPITNIPSIRWDIFILMVATSLLMLSLFTGKKNKIDRVEGVFFVIIYVIYLVSLFTIQVPIQA